MYSYQRLKTPRERCIHKVPSNVFDAAVTILAGEETLEVHFKGLSDAGVTTEQEAGKGLRHAIMTVPTKRS